MSIEKLKMMYGSRVKEYGDSIFVIDDNELLVGNERIKLRYKAVLGYKDILVTQSGNYPYSVNLLNVKTGASREVYGCRFFSKYVLENKGKELIIYSLLLKEVKRVDDNNWKYLDVFNKGTLICKGANKVVEITENGEINDR